MERSKFSIIRYSEESCSELTSLSDLTSLERGSVYWIDVDGVEDTATVQDIAHLFELHPLVIEDILHTSQRSKVDDYENYLFVVMRMPVGCDDDGLPSQLEQISLVLGKNFVLTFQEGIEGDPFTGIRTNIRSKKGNIRKLGADHLLYSLVDAIVDSYFLVLKELNDEAAVLDEELTSDDPPKDMLKRIYQLKRKALVVHRNIWPIREVVSRLERDDLKLVSKKTRLYLRDVYDHSLRIIENMELVRELISGMHDLYLSSISNRLNSVMKALTIISTIFLPLNFIAGVYGMNFHNMPELAQPNGYFYTLGLMLSIAIIMLLIFRRQKWI